MRRKNTGEYDNIYYMADHLFPHAVRLLKHKKKNFEVDLKNTKNKAEFLEALIIEMNEYKTTMSYIANNDAKKFYDYRDKFFEFLLKLESLIQSESDENEEIMSKYNKALNAKLELDIELDFLERNLDEITKLADEIIKMCEEKLEELSKI